MHRGASFSGVHAANRWQGFGSHGSGGGSAEINDLILNVPLRCKEHVAYLVSYIYYLKKYSLFYHSLELYRMDMRAKL